MLILDWITMRHSQLSAWLPSLSTKGSICFIVEILLALEACGEARQTPFRFTLEDCQTVFVYS